MFLFQLLVQFDELSVANLRSDGEVSLSLGV